MLTLKSLAIGADASVAQYPVRDLARARSFVVNASGETTVSLLAGHYEIRSNKGFTYRTTGAPVPHDQDVWLGLSLDAPETIMMSLPMGAVCWIVPAAAYDRDEDPILSIVVPEEIYEPPFDEGGF